MNRTMTNKTTFKIKARYMKTAKTETFIPPDSDDICWQIGSETFTRKEVAYLLWTQRAMISNDLKTFCGNDLTKDMFDILDKPRQPQF